MAAPDQGLVVEGGPLDVGRSKVSPVLVLCGLFPSSSLHEAPDNTIMMATAARVRIMAMACPPTGGRKRVPAEDQPDVWD
jgi:hypothetical protein